VLKERGSDLGQSLEAASADILADVKPSKATSVAKAKVDTSDSGSSGGEEEEDHAKRGATAMGEFRPHLHKRGEIPDGSKIFLSDPSTVGKNVT